MRFLINLVPTSAEFNTDIDFIAGDNANTFRGLLAIIYGVFTLIAVAPIVVLNKISKLMRGN